MTETFPAHDERKARARRWLVAALLFVLLRALPNLSYPIGHDQATYCVMGQGLLNGQQLYRDLWDNKPPGIFVLYAAVVKLFGPVMWSIGLVDLAWLLVISVCIFRFAERYLGTVEAATAVAVNGVWHCRVGYVDAGQPECFLMIAVFLAFFAVSSGKSWPMTRHFVAGLLMGGALWLKYNALAFLPLVAVIPYLDWARLDSSPKEIRFLIPWRLWCQRAGALLAGFGAMIVVVLAYFRWAGSWAALKEVQFQVLPRYTAMALQGIPHYWAFVIGRTIFWLGIWTLVATGVSLLISERRDLSRFLPVLAAAGMGYASTASQVRFRHYAFETCYPFFAMIWGYLGVHIYRSVRAAVQVTCAYRPLVAGVLKWGLVGSLALLAGGTEGTAIVNRYQALLAWYKNPGVFYSNYPAIHLDIEYLPGQMEIIRRLRQEPTLGSGLFVWGTDPLIYFLTQQRPPTRFISNLALISPWGPPAWREELVRDLKKSPPAFIVVAQKDQVPDISFTSLDSEKCLSAYPRLADFVSDSYNPTGEFPNFLLYRHKAVFKRSVSVRERCSSPQP